MANDIPLSMDAARAAKNDKSYTGARNITSEESKKLAEKKSSDLQISEATKKHLDRAAELNVKGTVNQAKAVPGVAYGVADIVAGEKVSGVVSIVKAAPNAIKGTVQTTQAKVETAKALYSANKDMKGRSIGEKIKINASLAKEATVSTKDAVLGAPAEVIEDVKSGVSAVKDIATGDKDISQVVAESSEKKALEKQEEKLEKKELKELDKQRDEEAKERTEEKFGNILDKMPVNVTVSTKNSVKVMDNKSVDETRMQRDAQRLNCNIEKIDAAEMQME